MFETYKKFVLEPNDQYSYLGHQCKFLNDSCELLSSVRVCVCVSVWVCGLLVQFQSKSFSKTLIRLWVQQSWLKDEEEHKEFRIAYRLLS